MSVYHLQAGSPLSYLIAFILPALDAILPVVPSETAVVALGVTTSRNWDPLIPLLVATAAAGAFVGDNVSYLIGRRFSGWAQRRFFAGPRGAERQAWAVRTLGHYGARLIVVCRFIPAGRTAVTLTCGITGYPRRRFAMATAVASVIWATYAFMIGRLGGKAFEDRPWAGLLLALAVTLAASGLIEAGRRLAGWLGSRRRQRQG